MKHHIKYTFISVHIMGSNLAERYVMFSNSSTSDKENNIHPGSNPIDRGSVLWMNSMRAITAHKGLSNTSGIWYFS